MNWKGHTLLKENKRSIRILLVDDNEEESLLTRTMLSRMGSGYSVDWVTTYEDLMVRLNKKADRYDLFLVDYHLGDHNGVDFLELPAVKDSGVPTVIITNDADVDMAALYAGAADYIHKSNMGVRTMERTIHYALERSQTLSELRHSEARYRAIVDDHVDMIVRFDLHGQLTFVNNAYCRHRGVPEVELLGTNYLEGVHPEDRQKLQSFKTAHNGSKPTTTTEVRADETNGITHWQQWTTQPIIDADGRLLEYQSVIRDVTDSRQVEDDLNNRLEQLRTLRRVDSELTETLNIEMVVGLALDSAMRLSAADCAVMALYNAETDRLEIVRSFGVMDPNLLAPMYRKRRGVIGRVVENKAGEYIADLANEPNYTPTLPAMQSLMVIPLLSQERFLGIITLETKRPDRFNEEIFDYITLVTARIAVSIDNARLYDLLTKRLDELERLYDQVTELEQLKTDMIRIAAHDLRNPLGIIKSYIDLLQMDMAKHDVDLKEFDTYLGPMTRAVGRMQRITTDVLTLERFERRETSEEQVDLSMVVRSVAEENEDAANHKSQDYIVDVPPVPTYVRGDLVQLQEAVSNLIGNAIKYTPEGGRVMVVLEYDGDAAVFEVIDNGYGIPFEQQSRLFQPFYRAKTPETSGVEGTGLGLHLVKSIVQRHAGRMIFSSRYMEGSTFGFQIPSAD